MEYKILKSNLILDHHNDFVQICTSIYSYLNKQYDTPDTTWVYDKYNIFNLTSGNILFYKLYQELNYHIRSFVGDNRPLWLQSWVNYHSQEDTLKKSLGEEQGFHGHNAKYHGYISIDPQNTITIFRNGLEIPNKIGQLYLGPGANSSITPPPEDPWDHYVKALTPFLKPRITIAFDISEYVNHALRSTFIPIL